MKATLVTALLAAVGASSAKRFLNIDGNKIDSAMAPRQVDWAKVVKPARLRKRLTVTSSTPCPEGQIHDNTNQCCAPTAIDSTGACCFTTLYNTPPVCCPVQRFNPTAKTCCPDTSNVDCNDPSRCCAYNGPYIAGTQCCFPTDGGKPSPSNDGQSTVCCPNDSIDATTGKCNCKTILTAPNGAVTCSPTGKLRRDGSVIQGRSVLTPRDAANLFAGAGNFHYGGVKVRDTSYEAGQKEGWKRLVSRGQSELFKRSLPVLALAIRNFFPDEDKLYPVSDNFDLRAGDMVATIDHLLDDPDLKHIDYKQVRFDRETLTSMRHMFPFVANYSSSAFPHK